MLYNNIINIVHKFKIHTEEQNPRGLHERQRCPNYQVVPPNDNKYIQLRFPYSD